MRKLIGALLAMSALVPVAAAAQDGRRGGPRAERQVNEDGSFERRAERDDDTASDPRPPRPAPPAREERQERRDDRQAFREDPRADRQAFRAERRDDVQDFRRERREDRADLAAGQLAPPAFRADRRDDRQDFRRDRRDDRQDFRAERREDRRDVRDDRRDDRPDARRDRRDGRRDWTRGDDWPQTSFGRSDWDRSSFNRDGRDGWNRGWRQDRRYDYNGYRGQNRAAYRLPRYYAPYGWGGGYRRFSIGISLTSALWARNYWIADPWAYRLPPAYGPYRWVRYYDDALLVDLRTGRVVDAVYGIFW